MRFIYTKAFAYFFFFLVLVAGLTFLEVKGLSDPIKRAFLNAPRPVIILVRSVTSPVKSFFTTLYGLRGISEENTELASKIFLLESQLVQYDQARKENEALKKELGFIAGVKDSYIPCSVLVYNPLGLSDTLIINCGTSSGIKEGQAVVSQGYLVGKVVYTSQHSSTVLLVTNSKFSADARMSKSGSSGVIKGSFGSGVVLDQLSQNEVIEKGQLVVTAGINDQIPKNILIGETGDVISQQNDLFKKVTVLSPLDFSQLRFVFIAK